VYPGRKRGKLLDLCRSSGGSKRDRVGNFHAEPVRGRSQKGKGAFRRTGNGEGLGGEKEAYRKRSSPRPLERPHIKAKPNENKKRNLTGEDWSGARG